MIRPNFARTQVAELDTLEIHIQNLISQIPEDGSTVDLQTLFYNMTFDTATEFLVGKSVGCQLAGKGTRGQLVAEAFNYAEKQMSTRLRLGRFAGLHRDAKFTRSCKLLHEVFDDLIGQARDEMRDAKENNMPDERYVFIKELLKLNTDLEQVRAEALNVLIAGRDTTAGLLSHIFHALARHPSVWAKLQAEVAQLKNQRPDYATLRGDMPYLKAILNEGTYLCDLCKGSANSSIHPSDHPPRLEAVSFSAHQHTICQQRYSTTPWRR
jgi:cytochrome P450